MAERVLELMELTGTPEDDCIGFEHQEMEWREVLLRKLWDHEQAATLRGQCNGLMAENETSGSQRQRMPE